MTVLAVTDAYRVLRDARRRLAVASSRDYPAASAAVARADAAYRAAQAALSQEVHDPFRRLPRRDPTRNR